MTNNIRPIISQHYSCNIYYVRNMCLGADVLRGEVQKPFNGSLAYDYLMWLDSDMVFSPEQFARLLPHQANVVSGLYLMESGTHFATVCDWDEEYFQKNGTFRFLSTDEVSSCTTPIEVAYTGMGFMLVKSGVTESLSYPWFKPIEKRIGQAVDFTMEDVSFCLRLREQGYPVLVDPLVRVGHEKSKVY